MRLAALVMMLCAGVCAAAPPAITSVTPAAIAPGKAVMISISGTELGGATRLWSDVDLKATPIKTTATMAAFEVTAPDGAAGVCMIRVMSRDGASAMLPLVVDPLPSVSEAGNNKTPAAAQSIALNTAIDGACDELTADYYRLSAKSGQRISIDVLAARAGSKADVVLRVLDKSGKALAECDDDPAASPDARLAFVAPADGDYVVEVRDAIYEGGAEYRYRLRVGDFDLPAAPVGLRAMRSLSAIDREPNDDGKAASVLLSGEGRFDRPGDVDVYAIDAKAGQRIGIRAGARSAGYAGDVRMTLRDAAGKVLARSDHDETDDAALSHKFGEAGRYLLAVEELNGLGGAGFGYRLIVGAPVPKFELASETDLINARGGGEISVNLTVTRANFKGEVTLAAQLDGVELAAKGKIAANQGAGVFKIKLPETLKTGQFAKLSIRGHASGDAEAVTAAKITPALRKVFPKMLHPPVELEGAILVYGLPAAATQPATRPAR